MSGCVVGEHVCRDDEDHGGHMHSGVSFGHRCAGCGASWRSTPPWPQTYMETPSILLVLPCDAEVVRAERLAELERMKNERQEAQ